MEFEYPPPFAAGESAIIPLGWPSSSLSSHTMKIAPPSRYAADCRMRGTHWESQASPLLTGSLVGHPDELCMSLQRSGVTKLYRATERLWRSVASSCRGRTWLMQATERESLRLVTSSKKSRGLCLAAYSPSLTSGHSVPSMPSWYAFHEIPACVSSETRWSLFGRWCDAGSASSWIP